MNNIIQNIKDRHGNTRETYKASRNFHIMYVLILLVFVLVKFGTVALFSTILVSFSTICVWVYQGNYEHFYERNN